MSIDSKSNESKILLDCSEIAAVEYTDSELVSSFALLDCNEVAAAEWKRAVNVGISDNETLNTIFEVSYFYCENFLNPL